MVLRIVAVIICFVLAVFSSPSFSQNASHRFTLDYTTVHGGLRMAVPYRPAGMPRVGLALAGGGAKAAASVGVLKVLHREGIRIAAIAGTSMGAGVGGLLAAGYDPEEIERIFLRNDWNDIFNDRPARTYLTLEQKEAANRHLLEFTFQEGRFVAPYGLTAGQKLTNLLAEKTLASSLEAELDFDRLTVPFRAVATDIETGEAVVLDRGLLHDAIRASTAIPLVFQPVETQGRLLVDGGLVNNLPVEVVRSMGADLVIAVDSSARLENKERLTSLVEIMSQAISLQVRRESERQASRADLVIAPDTSEYSFTDFPSIEGIIRKGEEAARAVLPKIRELLKPKRADGSMTGKLRITSLAVRGNMSVSEATIRFAMKQALWPREAAAAEIYEALSAVYELGYFSDLELSLERDGSGYHAILTVVENPVVSSVQVSGNTVLSDEVFLSALAWQEGRPLIVTRIAQELDRIIASYRSRGFLLARVEKTEVGRDGILRVTVCEGRVDSITLSGHRKTRRSLIRRETLTRPGSPLNFGAAAYDIQHLYALDYFESVGFDIVRSARGGLDLTLKIKEKPTNRVRFGLRYDLEDYFTGLTDFVVDNVGGRGVKVYLNSRYGNYTDLTLGYRSPVVLRSNFLHAVETFYRNRVFPIYENKHKVRELDITRKGMDVTFGYQWFRLGDTHLRYRFASDGTRESLGAAPPTERDRIGSWAFLSTVDTRDSSAFPGKGSLVRFLYETADPAYGGNADYSKTFLSGQEFLSPADRHTLVLQAAAGFGGGVIPYQEQFGIGGADDKISMPLPAYERREFTGDNLLAFSVGYRYRILDYQLSLVSALYFSLAWHGANVWDVKEDMSLQDLRNSGAIGLYADTVIGPVRLNFGMGEQHRYRVSFSAGFDF